MGQPVSENESFQQQTAGNVDISGSENATAFVNAAGNASIDQSRYITNNYYYQVEAAAAPSDGVLIASPNGLATETPDSQDSVPRIDRWEAPDVSTFYGRANELEMLERWVLGSGGEAVSQRCRLVTILGMGGIGKSSLTAKLVERIAGTQEQPSGEFEFVVWRSLRNAPTVEETLSGLIRFVSGQRAIQLPQSLDGLIRVFIRYLNECRCLLVLDNTESILQSRGRAGCYREGYEGYGELIRRIGESMHQSCVILTSREQPREAGSLEAQSYPVRSLHLPGLNTADGQKILQAKGLADIGEAQQKLLDRYSGNPLALQLAANMIQDAYFGDVPGFLAEGTLMLGDIRDLLDSQFERLTALDQEILYWLAINREPVSLSILKEDLVAPMADSRLRDSLESLVRRSLVERIQAGFTLQNVVMEYVTDRFVERVVEEFSDGRFELLHSHALIKTTTKDYVREAQTRLVLKPIADALIASSVQWQEWVQVCRSQPQRSTGYAPGNLLNLLCYSSQAVNGYDFSGLTIRNAYLKSMSLHNVNFADAHFVKPALTHPFSAVMAIAFSPDGTLMATADKSGDVHLWQVEDWQHLATYQGHSEIIQAIAFSPDGQTLVSGSEDHTIRIWNVQTQQCLFVLEGHTDWVLSVAIHPDGSILASSGRDKAICLWNLKTGQCLHRVQGELYSVLSIAFSPDGKTFACGNQDHSIGLWDLQTQKCLHILQGHSDQVRSVAFSPDGRMLVSGSYDNTVRLWEVQTQQCLEVLKEHQNWVLAVAFSPDGTMLASGSRDCTVRLWDVSTRQCLQVCQGHHNQVWAVAFSPTKDELLLASGSEDCTVRLWNLQNGQCDYLLQGYLNQISSVAFSPDGRVFASGSKDHTISLWDASTYRCLHIFRGHDDQVLSVAFSPDGRMLISGSNDHTIRLWDVQTKQCLYVFEGHDHGVRSVAFSPDGKMLASGGQDHTIRLWALQTRRCTHVLRDHESWVLSVAFSPDGRLLASSSRDRTVRLWDVSTQQCLHVLQEHRSQVRSVAFSPNGEMLASGSNDGTVRLWNVQSGQCLQVLEQHTNRVLTVAFSPDGQVLASGSRDQTICLWDLSTHQCVQVIKDHTNWVLSVCFSPNKDEQVLVSSDADATIKVWNIATREGVAVLKPPRPYEGTNIARVSGFSEAQKRALTLLGATDENF